ncbi:MAG TPA: hypothetical protein VGM23_11085 [Armatimonadota bacterium]
MKTLLSSTPVESARAAWRDGHTQRQPVFIADAVDDAIHNDRSDFEALLLANMAVSDDARHQTIAKQRFRLLAYRYRRAYRLMQAIACGMALIAGGLICR